MCVCSLVFTIPLHAARRAMVATCRCPHRQRAHFPAFKHSPILSPTTCDSNGATLSPFPHSRQTKERRKKTNKDRWAPCPYSSIPSRTGSTAPSASGSPATSSPSAAGPAVLGVSSGSLSPCSLRGGGVDLTSGPSAEPPSWLHRHQPLRRGVPRSWHT